VIGLPRTKKIQQRADVIAAQYYDALILLVEAAKSGASRTGIKSGLDRIKNFKGVLAGYISTPDTMEFTASWSARL
jgi:hypothetical protein